MSTTQIEHVKNMRVAAVVSGGGHSHRDASNNNNNHCSENDDDDSDIEQGGTNGRTENNNNWSNGSPTSMHSNGSVTANGGGGGVTTGGHMVDQAAMAAAADAEGVWSPDIDQAFQEALAIYPPCGRRKIILSDEGKMYGRNELIARYIKLRTGKTRTRKQVSSHIQVLARKKSREIQAKLKDSSAKEKALNSLTNMSSAQIVSMSALHNKAAAMNAAASVGLGAAVGGMYGMWNSAAAGFAAANQSALAAAAANEMDVKPAAFNSLAFPLAQRPPVTLANYSSAVNLPLSATHGVSPAWEGRTICTPKIRLCEFSAYCLPVPKDHTKRHDMVHITSSVTHADPMLEAIDISQIFDKFPTGNNGLRELYQRGPQNGFFLVKFWADLSFNVLDEQTAIFAVDGRYESGENMTISVSTKVCSFGKQVVEKVEHEYAKFENGRFVYRIQRSPMCEYMNNFIHKLKRLPERYMMNSVLENFTILQLVTSKETQDVLLCIAFVFEVSDGDGSQHRVYRLTYGGGSK